MTTRSYAPTDWPDVCRVHDRARAIELQRGGVDARAFRSMEEAAHDDEFFLSETRVAIADGKIVGFVSWNGSYITWLYVDPVHHREGIGRELVREAVDRIGSAAWTTTLGGNDAALSLFRAAGMEEVFRRPADCDGYPCVVVRLALPTSPMHDASRRRSPDDGRRRLRPRDIVRRGYDRVSEAYRSDDFRYEGTGYEKVVSAFVSCLASGARVLDLGCGCGVPVARVLAASCRVVGVDFSEVQVERARRLVPRAEFRCEDMTGLELAEASFDGIVSLFAIIHVPRGEQPGLFRSIARWLKPGGVTLLSVGHRAWTGTEEDWRGVTGATMYWSHADEETYVRWLQDLGLHVDRRFFIPEGAGGHPVLLARKEGPCS